MNNKTIQLVNAYVKSVMSHDLAHDFNHVNRVKNWALQIAKQESFKDLEIVEIAALMHDIGLTQAKKRSLHGEVGAEMAAKFLKNNNLLKQDKIAEIFKAIKFHNKNREGDGTTLLKILRDADMMDLFGAVGIMRAFTSKASMPAYDAANIKGKTWQMKAADFDKLFDSGKDIGDFIIDQLNF